MSLLKQLLISVTVAMVLILVGTLWFSLDSAREYLNERLQVDAQNTASSLALSLSQPSNQDPITQELLITALFDSGQYRSIALTQPDGEMVFSLDRAAESAQGNVPSWFNSWLPLYAPTIKQTVSNGWVQTGEIAVTPEDGLARQSLWGMAYQVVLLVLGAGLLWAVFAILLIRWLKRALQTEISEQVRAIAEGDQGRTEVRGSGIKELAQVRQVIESVRERVRVTAEEQSRQIEHLQLELNSDDVTGVANRRYFINELRRSLEAAELPDGSKMPDHGHVLIFRQRDLAAINALHDRRQADAWLRSVGEAVKAVLQVHQVEGRPVPQLARLNGSDFVILMSGYAGPDTVELIQAVRKALDGLRMRIANDRLCRWCYALTDYEPSCDVGQVLVRLDHGLMRAESAGTTDVEYLSVSEFRSTVPQVGAGETAWKQLILDALADNRLELVVKPATYRDDDVDQRHEGFVALREAGGGASLISGYMFMPPAVRLGLSGACDLRVVGLAAQWVRDHPGHLAIRVSLPSLLQMEFLEGVEFIVMQSGLLPEQLQRLCIEIDAHGFVAHPDEVQAFSNMVTAAGCRIGVRRLAEQPGALLNLHKVDVRYLKLDGGLITSLLESPGAFQLFTAITEAAIGQGIKLYADGVPDAPTAKMLQEYGVLMSSKDVFLPDDHTDEGGFVDN